jgi:hypothetical protein
LGDRYSQAVYPWDSGTFLKLPLFADECPFFGPQIFSNNFFF